MDDRLQIAASTLLHNACYIGQLPFSDPGFNKIEGGPVQADDHNFGIMRLIFHNIQCPMTNGQYQLQAVSDLSLSLQYLSQLPPPIDHTGS